MKIHMVKKGDTLYLIAKKYNVPLEELIQANPEIANPDVIDVGMKVKIPMPSKPAVEVMHHHIVQQGDTLWKLSKSWGIPLSELIKANPQLKNPNVLLTGEVVHIPKPSVQESELMPQATSAPPSSGMIPGKKNTAVMPEAVMPEPPAHPKPAPEQVSEIQEAPKPVKEETAPAPKHPYPEHKHPYPEMTHPYPEHKHPHPEHKHPYPHEGHHHLFAQFPFPAMEATAPATHKHVPADCGMMHEQTVQSPFFAQLPPIGHKYAAQGQADYAAQDHTGAQGHAGHGYAYGYDAMGAGLPSGVKDAAGAMYHPADLSGYGVKSDGYGDISQTGAAKGHGTAGYMPWQVAPATGAYPPVYGMPYAHGGCGCGCGGGSMAMPAHGGYGWPSGAYMHAAPMNPWNPLMYPAYATPSGSGCQGRIGDDAGVNAAGNFGAAPGASLPPLPTYSSEQALSGQEASQAQSAKDGEPPLSLHHVDDASASDAASSNKKRSGAGKPKRKTRKAKPQRKQNLPWIR